MAQDYELTPEQEREFDKLVDAGVGSPEQIMRRGAPRIPLQEKVQLSLDIDEESATVNRPQKPAGPRVPTGPRRKMKANSRARGETTPEEDGWSPLK
jgi:hypothetical protein